MAKKEKKNKKTKEKQEAGANDQILRPVRGPGFWIALISIPVIIAIYFQLAAPPSVPAGPEQVETIREASDNPDHQQYEYSIRPYGMNSSGQDSESTRSRDFSRRKQGSDGTHSGTVNRPRSR